MEYEKRSPKDLDYIIRKMKIKHLERGCTLKQRHKRRKREKKVWIQHRMQNQIIKTQKKKKIKQRLEHKVIEDARIITKKQTYNTRKSMKRLRFLWCCNAWWKK